MTKIYHQRYHWITVALVASAALIAFEAWGQGSGAAAVFEGRPSMAGAQGGQGAMAGPPTGGIGLQGSEGTQLKLRRPAALDTPGNMPQGSMDNPPPAVALANGDAVRAKDLLPAQKDTGLAKNKRSASDKVRRAAKRTVEGAKYGVSPMDTR